MVSLPAARRLHQLFDLAVLVKAADGILEVCGGLLLLFVPLQTLDDVLRALMAHELPIGRGDWFVDALYHFADSLSVSTKLFASFYLLGHGVVKLVLVVSLWREKLWAFPIALTFIVAFACYQVYRFTHTHSLPLLVFTAIDVCVAGLVWREYRVRTHAAGAGEILPKLVR